MKRILICLSFLIYCQAQVISQQSIVGTWQYESIYGNTQIVFNKDNTVIIDGVTSKYAVEGNNIIIQDAYGSYSYPYQFRNGKLVMTFQDGSQVEFKKTGQNISTSSSGTSTGTTGSGPGASKGPSGNQAGSIKSLIGRWEYTSAEGQIVLSFISENTLVYDGEQVNYYLDNGAFNVNGDYGIVAYPYTLSGNNLTISFPEGYQLTFKRAQKTSGGQGTGNLSSSKGGNAGQLSGKLCFYSGSSTTYSSYSRMEYIYFDGNGRFQFWKETSYSSDAGLAYGQDQDPNYVGSYSVNGNVVTMTFDSGHTNILKVHFRQKNGRITELMYKDKLYAAGLCE